MEVRIEVDGRLFDVRLAPEEDGAWHADVDGEAFHVRLDRRGPGTLARVDGTAHFIDVPGPRHARIDGHDVYFEVHRLLGVAGLEAAGAPSLGPIHPPMMGKVEAVLVEVGQDVNRGQVLFVLEAMKMRNEVKAPADGVVTAVHIQAGDAVEPDRPALELGPA